MRARAQVVSGSLRGGNARARAPQIAAMSSDENAWATLTLATYHLGSEGTWADIEVLLGDYTPNVLALCGVNEKILLTDHEGYQAVRGVTKSGVARTALLIESGSLAEWGTFALSPRSHLTWAQFRAEGVMLTAGALGLSRPRLLNPGLPEEQIDSLLRWILSRRPALTFALGNWGDQAHNEALAEARLRTHSAGSERRDLLCTPEDRVKIVAAETRRLHSTHRAAIFTAMAPRP